MVAGYVSLLCSISDKPLEYWSKQQSQSGRIRKILDSDLLENVIEIQDFEQPNGYGTSILSPYDSSQFLNIELPILVVIIKNLNLQCRLQVQVLDTQNCLHHFQFSNSENEKQSSKGVICRVKVKLETGWNKLELNLAHLTQAAFKSQYAVTQRLQVSGNCRLRRIYFIDKHYENEEICPKLYQGFLDSYMQKWGIRGVETATQTSAKRNKSKIKSLSKHHSNENFSADETACNTAKDSIGRKIINDSFLRSLQMKADILINDFFDRQSTPVPHISEFKQQTKLKRYAIPSLSAKQKSFGSTAVSEDALKKINVLRTFTETYIPTEDKQKEENAMKSIRDSWQQRYFHQEIPLNECFLPKQNTKRTMLERKPRSLLLLPTIKPGNGNGKTSAKEKKSIVDN
ncbi:uncharacterized protein LOC143179929 [Calliopsis andreniformis]|uniref:uncharacterized protein LOC143179929 n=1 Tax=Calliopsis andreniformis TaxID=337506 RepID=UPI003FCE7377